ncbi:TetR/AcrR family transcriptional regulator [Pontibacter korlensis]|uniref:TetR family transcriptional regulator n=1 Tax=Pontibacter korlensis TaxID=400092 RepID=A0A0E3ZIK5_9BACT|nr:TetR/AcrR family transcriptional regulator [Pontibacter korlensis]AKD04714.1 TetR family transcriptional regulator [Pontibacter korlensis]
MEPIPEKKKAIFESTLGLVREKGFHGTPVSLVAKNAGVAAGTIYHYFDSKETLMRELFDYIQQQVIHVVLTEDKKDTSFKECFFNIWFSLFSFYSGNPNVFRFMEQFINSPYNTGERELGKDEFHRLLFRFFERGINEGALKPMNPKLLGTLAFSNVITTAKILSSGRLELQEGELEQIPQILWEGMKNR